VLPRALSPRSSPLHGCFQCFRVLSVPSSLLHTVDLPPYYHRQIAVSSSCVPVGAKRPDGAPCNWPPHAFTASLYRSVCLRVSGPTIRPTNVGPHPTYFPHLLSVSASSPSLTSSQLAVLTPCARFPWGCLPVPQFFFPHTVFLLDAGFPVIRLKQMWFFDSEALPRLQSLLLSFQAAPLFF